MTELGQKLIASVRAKAEANPNFVYDKVKRVVVPGIPPAESCVYVMDGQPSCIVGHGLWEGGLINAEFEYSPSNGDAVRHLIDDMDLDIDPVEASWINTVQYEQDRQTPWGTAVAIADAQHADIDD